MNQAVVARCTECHWMQTQATEPGVTTALWGLASAQCPTMQPDGTRCPGRIVVSAEVYMDSGGTLPDDVQHVPEP